MAAVAEPGPQLGLAAGSAARWADSADQPTAHLLRFAAPRGAGHGAADGVRRLRDDATNAAQDQGTGRGRAPTPCPLIRGRRVAGRRRPCIVRLRRRAYVYVRDAPAMTER